MAAAHSRPARRSSSAPAWSSAPTSAVTKLPGMLAQRKLDSRVWRSCRGRPTRRKATTADARQGHAQRPAAGARPAGRRDRRAARRSARWIEQSGVKIERQRRCC